MRCELSAYSGREVRLVFVGPHHIQNLQWMSVDGDAPATSITTATTAMHSRTGETATLLDGSNQKEVSLSPGENLEFTFRVPPVPEGKVRDYYFASLGVYSTLPADDAPVSKLPDKLELLPAVPNPTDGSVRMAFALPTPARIRFSVFDPMGRLVVRLAEGNKEAGRHDLTWDLKDRSGRRVSPGIYFYRMDVGGWKQQRTLTVR